MHLCSGSSLLGSAKLHFGLVVPIMISLCMFFLNDLQCLVFLNLVVFIVELVFISFLL